MFYNKYKIKWNLINQDIILINKSKLFLENINLSINKYNNLIKGKNGSGKSILTSQYITKINLFIHWSTNIYFFILNWVYYNFNFFFFNFNKIKSTINILSYGNKQLIIFNLSCILSNNLLVFDEITNGLDKYNHKNILNKLILFNIFNKKIILISHTNLIKIKNTLLYLL